MNVRMNEITNKKMVYWIFTGLSIIALMYYSINSSKETAKDMDTKEFLWKITKVSEKMENKGQATIDHPFATVVLKWEKKNVYTLHIKQNQDTIVHDGTGTYFLGVGFERCKRQTLSHWYESKVASTSDFYDLPIKSVLVCPENTLTVFVRISTYPSPSYDTAENRQGYDNTHYIDVAQEDKSTDKSNEVGGKDRLCRNSKVFNNLSKNLKDFYLEDKDPDVSIIVRNENLSAHRAILKARSSVLAAMLNQEMAEIQELEYDPADFEIFLLFLYSGIVENLTTDNVISVYNIAYKYQVTDLMETCGGYMVSSLSVNSVSNVIRVALMHNDYKLQKYATDFFLKHAEKIFRTIEWQAFLTENPATANEFVIQSMEYSSLH